MQQTQHIYIRKIALFFVVFYLLTMFSYGHEGRLTYITDTTDDRRTVAGNNPLDTVSDKGSYLLANHPLFTDHWINNETFVYEDISIDQIPDEVVLSLTENDQQFTLTWHGSLTSTYKWRWGRQHHGLDLGLRTGDTVLAAFDGVVRYAQFNKSGFGNCIVIRHLNGLETVYGHLSKILVKPNQYVSSGEYIGLGGSTGHSTGPHLHFETRYKDFSFDPQKFINVETKSLLTNTLVLHKSELSSYKSKYASITKKIDPVTGQLADSTIKQTQVTKPAVPQPTSVKKEDVIPVTPTPVKKEVAVEKTAPVAKNEKVVVAPKTAPKQKTATKQVNSSKQKEKKSATDSKITNNKKAKTSNDKKTDKSSKNAKKSKSYVVKDGDNLTFISKKTGVSIDKLRKLNKIKSDYRMKPGQTIILN